MRHMILENAGYEVVSAQGLEKSLEYCKQGGFDGFVLGHSIPANDKRKMAEAFRQSCSAPIISLLRGASERRLDGADFHIDPDPEPLLKLLLETTRAKNA
jgi:DNA-binding response OmpR family regulator